MMIISGWIFMFFRYGTSCALITPLSNTIEVFVGRIRKKLDVDIIQTVRGLGYLLTPPTPGA